MQLYSINHSVVYWSASSHKCPSIKFELVYNILQHYCVYIDWAARQVQAGPGMIVKVRIGVAK